MLTITGKSIITTDWHFGVRNDSPKYHKTLMDVIRSINKYADNDGIENLIFCGDIFHKRNMISVDTINIAVKSVESISKHFKNVYLILGNHDLFNQSNNEVYSPLMFKNTKNIHIIKDAEEVNINDKRCLFSPWLTDLTKYDKCTFDMIFGHFDISGKYMANSWKENVKKRNLTPEEIKLELERDELLQDAGIDMLEFENENTEETYLNNKKTSDLLGSWIEIVKENGTIFAGHIHRHKEFYTKGRKFIFIGSPYQQNMGEINSEDGFYVMDESGTYRFEMLNEVPKHVDIRISDIVKDIEKYDFSHLSGNIIHKIYDMEISPEVDARITKKIVDMRPYDEVHPDYIISKSSDGEDISSDTLDKLSKSPLEYLRSYIYDMDDKIFETKGITKDELFDTTKKYYDMVGGE